MTRTTYAFVLLVIAAALAIAGCGGSDNNGESGNNSSAYGGGYGGGGGGNGEEKPTASNEGGSAAVVSLASVPKLGMVIVDSKGFTLYDFHKDKGTTSACYGACEQAWPPLSTEGEPEVGNGASASMLGTTERKDGTMQVTYAGHPLYTFVEDKKPGEANGNDFSAFGGEWYALNGNGEDAEG